MPASSVTASSCWASPSAAWTARTGALRGIELRVHPSLVPMKRLIANVEGAMNAVMVQGDAVGTTLYYGKGAGSEPTASAVIADLVDITRLHTADAAQRVPHLAFQPDAMSDLPVLPMSEIVTSYYLRLRVADQAGVLAKVTGILADAGISIDAMLQREADEVVAAGAGGPDRPDHPDPRHARRHDGRCAGPHAGVAQRVAADHPHSQGRTGLMEYLSTRGHEPDSTSATSCWKGWRRTAACTCRAPIPGSMTRR
jgi:hypothetical protein